MSCSWTKPKSPPVYLHPNPNSLRKESIQIPLGPGNGVEVRYLPSNDLRTLPMGCSVHQMDNFTSNIEIIECCKQATPDVLLGDPSSDNKVLRLNDDLVVKFGFLLSEDEARNQTKAYEILDPSIVRVPRVYQYFMDSERCGYIVMDYMKGEKKEAITDSTQIRDMSRVLQHFASKKSYRPGSLTGGPSCCILFGESDFPTFASVEDLENWFNIRLLEPTARISFEGLDIVLCHLDLFPRNILWLDGQPPCVLDWASAGFYPRLFERCSQLISQQPEENEVILKQGLSQFESLQVSLVLRAWWNNVKYCL